MDSMGSAEAEKYLLERLIEDEEESELFFRLCFFARHLVDVSNGKNESFSLVRETYFILCRKKLERRKAKEKKAVVEKHFATLDVERALKVPASWR